MEEAYEESPDKVRCGYCPLHCRSAFRCRRASLTGALRLHHGPTWSLLCACQIFLKLQKRLSRSPTQVIRYSFGGKPLFISAVTQEEQNRLGPCPHCHGDRVFEMQLVPAAADEILRRYVSVIPAANYVPYMCAFPRWCSGG